MSERLSSRSPPPSDDGSPPNDDGSPTDDDSGAIANRRRFLTATAGAGVLGAVAGCTGLDSDESDPDDSTNETVSLDADPDDADDVDDLPLFDAHTHIIPMESRGNDPLFVDDLVDWMDDNGVDYAAVQALDSPEAYPVQAPSWWILEECEKYDDRLVPFVTIDPRALHYGEEATAVLDEYLDRGARGFGELKAGIDIDDEQAMETYELCADRDLSVLFHTDETAMTDEIGLPGLEDVLESFPDVDFVAHAHGWWIHVDGDVDTMARDSAHDGPIESEGRVPELLEAYDNIYADISAGAGWDALSRDEEFTQEFFETHHEQIVFGSDYLFPDQTIEQFQLFETVDLDLEAWADIRYRNFESLLR